MLDRYQILKGRDEDSARYYVVLDSEFEYIVAEGSLKEMITFQKKRESDDKILLWQ